MFWKSVKRNLNSLRVKALLGFGLLMLLLFAAGLVGSSMLIKHSLRTYLTHRNEGELKLMQLPYITGLPRYQRGQEIPESEITPQERAFLRKKFPDGKPLFAFADLVVDLRRRKARRGELEIELQPLEFSLLEYLVRNAGRVVSKTMIMEHVWEYNFDPRTNIVESRICRLREKIDKPFKTKLLHTVRGFGYVLEERKTES